MQRLIWQGDSRTRPITDTGFYIHGHFFAGNLPFVGNDVDLGNLEKVLGLKYSCSSVARIINNNLMKNGCPITVSCDKDDDSCFRIGTGVKMTGIWAK